MAEIDVRPIDDWTFEVTVRARSTTTHEVKLDPTYHTKLTAGRYPPDELIRRSFEFLLEREPNTSILRRFELPVIQQYFPEYERTMEKILE